MTDSTRPMLDTISRARTHEIGLVIGGDEGADQSAAVCRDDCHLFWRSKACQPSVRGRVSLGHGDGELTVDVLLERHGAPVETFLFGLARSERMNDRVQFVTARRQETGSKR